MPLKVRQLSTDYDVLAPDGSEVRLLAECGRGSMAHFTLPVGQTSLAVAHHTVEEVWYILSGVGEMWRKVDDAESITVLREGLSLTIPVGAHFQFRNTGDVPLKAVAVTMPPWPEMDEAFEVTGKW
jgi:mannose-6-phosphate isomerase-like protein (cupin superfamily)